MYLIDLGQTVLEPIPDRSALPDPPSAEDVSTTLAGRCFRDQRIVTAQRGDGIRVWAPVIEGSDRTGVIAVTVPAAVDEMSHRRREEDIVKATRCCAQGCVGRRSNRRPAVGDWIAAIDGALCTWTCASSESPQAVLRAANIDR